MKILLIFDSSNLENVGCKSTSLGIKILYQDYKLSSIFSEEIFELNRNLIKSSLILKIIIRFKFLKERFFCKYTSFLLSKNPIFIEKIKDNDIILINGEGTIHHDKFTGLFLLSIIKISKKFNKKVFLINSTIQDIGKESIKILSKLDEIVVRDFFSQKYLKLKGINATLGADAAWVFMNNKIKEIKSIPDKNKILITGGVSFVEQHIDYLFKNIKKDKKVYYLYVDSADKINIKSLKKRGFRLNIIYADKIFNKNIYDFFLMLSKFGFIFSGRHHIAIFAYYLRIPFIPLKSNTYKIEGTIHTLFALGYKKNIIGSCILLDKKKLSLAINLAQNNLVNFFK